MSLYPLVETMTAPVADRLVRAARIRQPLRRLAWRNAVQDAINNLSSGVESRHAHNKGSYAQTLAVGSQGLQATGAGVAPGLLNTFHPANPAKSADVSCVVSAADAASCEGSQGGATSASPSGDSVRGNATA